MRKKLAKSARKLKVKEQLSGYVSEPSASKHSSSTPCAHGATPAQIQRIGDWCDMNKAFNEAPECGQGSGIYRARATMNTAVHGTKGVVLRHVSKTDSVRPGWSSHRSDEERSEGCLTPGNDPSHHTRRESVDAGYDYPAAPLLYPFHHGRCA